MSASQRAEYRRELRELKKSELVAMTAIRREAKEAKQLATQIERLVAKRIAEHRATLAKSAKRLKRVTAETERSVAGIRKRRQILEGRLAS